MKMCKGIHKVRKTVEKLPFFNGMCTCRLAKVKPLAKEILFIHGHFVRLFLINLSSRHKVIHLRRYIKYYLLHLCRNMLATHLYLCE